MKESNKPSISIIGGSGFIGKNISIKLENLGYDIISISRSLNINLNSKLKQISLDIQDTDKLIESTKNSNIIFWLANNSVPANNHNSSEADYLENTLPLIRYTKDITSPKLIIYFSSGGTVYGNVENEFPIIEETELSPISQYGNSKKVTENHFLNTEVNPNLKLVVLRPSNVYGPNQNFKNNQGIIGFGINAIINNTVLNVYGDGSLIRDFLYIDDLIDALLSIIKNQNIIENKSILNVSSGTGFSINNILNYIEKISNSKFSIVYHSYRHFDCKYNVLNNQKIKNLTGWSPKVSIDEGIQLTWDSYKQ
jgi:UDP-glucose 4-epimerase